MAARRAVRMGMAGALALGVCGYFATRARGSEEVPQNTLLAKHAGEKRWTRAFLLSVPALRALKAGPELAERPDGTNLIKIQQAALFKKYLSGSLNSPAFILRCQRIASVAPAADMDTAGPELVPGVALPDAAKGQLRVVAARDTELLLQQTGSPLLVWFAVEERLPQWVGDAHSLYFYYGTSLDTSQCGIGDYLSYLIDVWQGRLIVNEGAHKALTRNLLPPKSTAAPK